MFLRKEKEKKRRERERVGEEVCVSERERKRKRTYLESQKFKMFFALPQAVKKSVASERCCVPPWG